MNSPSVSSLPGASAPRHPCASPARFRVGGFHRLFRTALSRLGVLGLLLLPFAVSAQDITGTWHFKGYEWEGETLEVAAASYTVTITNLGGGNYRFVFTGADTGEFETALTQEGNVYRGTIRTETDAEAPTTDYHRRTLIRVINANTLTFSEAEARLAKPTAQFNPNFQWSFYGYVAVATRSALTNSPNPALWAGNFTAGPELSNLSVTGSGLSSTVSYPGGESVSLVSTSGGYRVLAVDDAPGLFTTAGSILSRTTTLPNRIISKNDSEVHETTMRRQEERLLQMPNGDVVVFYLAGDIARSRGGVLNPGRTPFTYLSQMEVATTYVTRQGEAVSITSSPSSRSVEVGGSTTFTATINQPAGTTPTFQWYRNDAAVAGATSLSLSLTNIQGAEAGSYRLGVTSGNVTSYTTPAVLGVISTAKAGGGAREFAPDIRHPNGNFYDQVLLENAAGTVTADGAQVTRTSFIDLNDDIVQVEFAGAGSLSISLAGASGPAVPAKYNQSTVTYMKGHATITITGANETTNVTIFSVGRLTAFDPTGAYDITKAPGPTNNPANTGSPLFRASETYDGRADVALLNIISSNGKFGGIRGANASFWATAGNTGVYAPGVQFTGPVFVHDVNAREQATPVLVTGTIDNGGEIRITGGDLLQENDRAVRIEGATKVTMAAGITSHGTDLSANLNSAVIERNDAIVTDSVVVNPE
jgi:hypothetical protein